MYVLACVYLLVILGILKSNSNKRGSPEARRAGLTGKTLSCVDTCPERVTGMGHSALGERRQGKIVVVVVWLL